MKYNISIQVYGINLIARKHVFPFFFSRKQKHLSLNLNFVSCIESVYITRVTRFTRVQIVVFSTMGNIYIYIYIK